MNLSNPNAVWRVCVCRLFKSNAHGRPFGPQSNAGDKIGCGINFSEVVNDDPQRRMVPVVFTRNGNEVRLTSMFCLCWRPRQPVVTDDAVCIIYSFLHLFHSPAKFCTCFCCLKTGTVDLKL